MSVRGDIYRRAASSDPSVAIPALVRLGRIFPIAATTDTGFRDYGTGRLLLLAGTNYAQNGSFEIDTDGDGRADWVTYQSTITGTLTYTRVPGRKGGYAQRVQMVAGAGDAGVQRGPLYQRSSIGADASSPQTFWPTDWVMGSVYAKVAMSAGTMVLYVRPVVATNWGGAAPVVTVPMANSADWVRYGGAALMADARTIAAAMSIMWTSVSAGDTLDLIVDDCDITKDHALCPHGEGPQAWDSASDWAWAAAANESLASRAVSSLVIPPPSGMFTAGTVICRAAPLGSSAQFISQTIWSLYYGSNDRIHCEGGAAGGIRLRTRLNSSSLTGAEAPSHTAGQVMRLIQRWTAGGSHVSTVNGTSITTNGVYTSTVQPTQFQVAANSLNSPPGSAVSIGPAVLIPANISATEVSSADAMLAAGATGLDFMRWCSRLGYLGARVAPLDHDGTSYEVRA